MRSSLVAALFVLTVSGCTCGACAPRPPAPHDAGPPAVAAVPDAGAPPLDAGELPWELTQHPPAPEALVARYAADCRAEVTAEFDDMEGPRSAAECDALAFDQNCSPDLFGCWEAKEKCRADCASPCHGCEARCGDGCEGCKVACQGEPECVQRCARQRNDCRLSCLYQLQRCRQVTCEKSETTCLEDADARVKQQCPDCDAIRACIEKAIDDSKPTEPCLAPAARNARECLEWCSPGP